MALGGSGGMLSRKVFKTLDTVMATLELFEQFLWQILLIFLPLTLSPSPNVIHFVRMFSIYACLRRKDDCYQIGLNLWKIVFIKNSVERVWWGDASFHAEIVTYYNCMPFCKNLF